MFISSNVLALLTGVHLAAKWELKNSDFTSKSYTSLQSARIGGMAGIFLLLKNLLVMDQYVFGAVLSYLI